MRVAIVGCGFIGRKRAKALGNCTLRFCCDSEGGRAAALAGEHSGAEVIEDWRQAVAHPEVDIVVVATPHHLLADVAAAAASESKHVLVEKPCARRADELDAVHEAARRTGALVRSGFNHRYHRAFRKSREIFASGVLGEMMFVRGRYGHGGRPGYEREWRAIPEISGGGEAIDQGVHLIDLARWFLGDFPKVTGFAGTYFWNMPVDDNAFFLLRTESDRVACLHASWTEWKNLFSFEIYGHEGKLEVNGLGGSYGVERLAYYRMLPAMGPPETIIYEYPMSDDSWEAEFADFLEDIRLRRTPSPGIADAQAALRIVERVYEMSRS
jgi:predicted dehydrogenase